MPNWCNNVATLTHPDPTMIARLLKAADGNTGVLQELIPCPQDLLIEKGSFADTDKQAALDAQGAANIKKYGYADWYDWRVANWGTKWDLCDLTASQPFADTVLLHFDTAWSPPIEAYEKLEALGFTVLAYYYEAGMQFAGIYQDGNDDCYQNWGDSKGATATLPSELDETFEIAATQAEWEKEDEELYVWTKEGAKEKGLASE